MATSRWICGALFVVACAERPDAPPFSASGQPDAGMPIDAALPPVLPPVVLTPSPTDAGRDAEADDLTPVHIDGCGADNPAGVTADEVARLRSADDAPRVPWLYPLDGTVMPRGLRAPLLMWEGGASPRAVYVRLSARTFLYEGCLSARADGRVALPEGVWTRASERGFGKLDPFSLEVRELAADGTVRSRSQSTLIVAPGSLKGSIYYNSYRSELAADAGAPGGAVLRVRAGQDAEVFAGQRGCIGCHAVSANGSRLVASNLSDGSNQEGVYALGPNTPGNPPSLRAGTDFVGLYPDGTLYATGRSIYDPSPPGLFETDTGTLVASAQLPDGAQHPSFSPSGKLLALVEYPGDAGSALGPEVVTFAYDAGARTFEDRQVRTRLDGGTPDWPTVLPDDQALVFAELERPRLVLHDLASGRDIQLLRAAGYGSQREADEDTFIDDAYGYGFGPHGIYYPTVVPVAIGGYFWVFFDSYRPYGNVRPVGPVTEVAPPAPPLDPPPSGLPDWLDVLLNGPRDAGAPVPDPGVPPSDPTPYVPPSRQIWGAAIEVSPDGSYRIDPSHPPFYVDGQELGTNNHRAFAALDPCSPSGAPCTSGIDCCGGFCEQGQCGSPQGRCARAEEACTAHGDCCDGSQRCINGFCSVVDVLR